MVFAVSTTQTSVIVSEGLFILSKSCLNLLVTVQKDDVSSIN